MSTKELSDSDIKYLAQFNTQDEIENEIHRLHFIRKDIRRLASNININTTMHLGNHIYEELDLSIIDKYHLIETHWKDNNRILSPILSMCKDFNINEDHDVVVTVYKLYTHIKSIKKNMKEAYEKKISEFNQENGTNFDETNFNEKLYTDKVILLYDKLVKLL